MNINMDMITNMNLNLLSIILYISGIVGIIIFFLAIVLAIKKNTKTSAVLVMIMFILSIGLLGSGTYFKILNNKKNPPVVNTEEISQNNLEVKNQTQPSLDDLRFSYKFTSYDTSQKNANIHIKNNSDSIFNGKVNLNFVDSNQNIVDTLTLQIKNLLPKKLYNPSAIIKNNVSDIDYSFSGDFSNIVQPNEVPYTIDKLSTGNNFILLNISAKDTSKNHLEQICNQVASQYNNSDCDGVLIYFYPENANSSSSLDFQNAVADYYLNNKTKTSKFTYY